MSILIHMWNYLHILILREQNNFFVVNLITSWGYLEGMASKTAYKVLISCLCLKIDKKVCNVFSIKYRIKFMNRI